MTEYDVEVAPFVTWLSLRLRQNKRDKVDNLAKRLLADKRIPRQASRSMYLAQLRSKGYSEQDQQTFLAAWSEMREQTEEE